MKRANTEDLRKIFLKYATSEKNGEKVISNEDFVTKFLDLLAGTYNPEEAQLIAGIVDKNRDGYISFAEFQEYEILLTRPDAFFETLCLLFDTKRSGVIGYDDFSDVMLKTETHKKVPTVLGSPFVNLYFGPTNTRKLPYNEFSQFLHDIHDVYALEYYKQMDPNEKGFISSQDFKDLLYTVKYHMLTEHMREKVLKVGFPPGKRQIHFPYFMAFTSLLNNMALLKRIYLEIAKRDRKKGVTKEQFLHSAQMMSQITPLEVDILYDICGMLENASGLITYKHLQLITPEQYYKIVNQRITNIHAVKSPSDRSAFIQVLENLYRFFLGAIAGAIGATTVYPIDLVKTRIQNQRIGKDGKKMYDGVVDCFQKIIKNEGVKGLYRGLPTQLVGIAPEKAIKLSVNDFMRDKLSDKKGHLSYPREAIAGGTSGFCQVVVTNPLEIVKIRLQMAGEVGKRMKAWQVIKELGLFGLYKGARACWMRDIGFTAIYFPTYSHVKAHLADEHGYNHPLTLLASGAIAGIPAASLATPADVIKTRLQVVPQAGQTTYNGIFDCIRKMAREEGPKAFWKGAIVRVCRSSPQFGVTLLMYEILQRLFYVDFGGSHPPGSEYRELTVVDERLSRPDHIGGYHIMRQIIIGLGHKFGISFEGTPPPSPVSQKT